jgi:ABC-type sugar transport system substrate-binding protein
MFRLLACVLACLTLSGCSGRPTGPRTLRVGFIPKLTGIPYFNACKKGAEQAAAELHLELVYNGPSRTDVDEQVRLIRQWAAAGEVDMLCVACNQPDRIAGALREARQAGIPVITYDADSTADARDFFVNQATYVSVARMMADEMAAQLDPPGTGQVGILTSSTEAPNQAQWARRLKDYVRKKYPKMELLPETQHGEDRDLGIIKAKALIEANPGIKGIIGLTSVAVPAAAEAVRQEKKKGVIKVTGVSTPRDMRGYLADGTVDSFVLWDPVDLGYLAVYVADLKRRGQMPQAGTFDAGRLKKILVADREVLLGPPIRFDRKNIDQFDF